MSHKHVRLAREQLTDGPQVIDPALRPAMRCVEMTKIAPGRQLLPSGWWNSDFESGSTVRWREQVTQKRAQLRARAR